MKSQKEVLDILNDFKKDLKKIYGSQFSDLILFGSYARGDFQEGSDVDLMVILKNMNLKDRWKEYEKLSDVLLQYNLKNDLYFSPLIYDQASYQRTDFFFRNVKKDQVIV